MAWAMTDREALTCSTWELTRNFQTTWTTLRISTSLRFLSLLPSRCCAQVFPSFYFWSGVGRGHRGARNRSGLGPATPKLAERVGFEPTLEFPLNTLST